MSKNNTGKLQLLGFVLLSLVAGVLLATSSCSSSGTAINSTSNNINNFSNNYYSSNSDIAQSSILESGTKSESVLNSISSSINDDSGSSGTGSFENEKPVETKNRTFHINVTLEMIRNLFDNIFSTLPSIATPNIEYTDELLITKKLTLTCPLCGENIETEATLYSNGQLVFLQNHAHFDEETIVDLADVFYNYIRKESSVLIGGNYKNDFGIIYKNNKWYFEFLGLNLPIFKNEVDVRTDSLLNAFGEFKIEAKMNSKGTGFDFTSFYETMPEADLKNAIPLLFYEEFANILIENNSFEACQNLINEAYEDVQKEKFNRHYLNTNYSILDNIKYFHSLSYEYNLLGEPAEAIGTNYYYDTSTRTILSNCFIEMFATANPNFVNTNEVYIQYSDEYFNGPSILFVDNKAQGESGAPFQFNLWNLDNGNFFFPFFNCFASYPVSSPGNEDPIDSPQYYSSELGKTARIGSFTNFLTTYYEDDFSINTNIEDYFFEWSVTDAYYFILDYLTSNCYLRSAKLLYAEAYNNFSKTISIVDSPVLIKNTLAQDITEQSTTTLYGIVDKQKLLNGEVVKMGFDVRENGVITTYLTDQYTTQVTIDDVTYNDANSFYFYQDFEYNEYIEARFFVEYNDSIVYSNWR